MVSLAPHERVQQRIAERIEGAPQYPDETLEMVRLIPTE